MRITCCSAYSAGLIVKPTVPEPHLDAAAAWLDLGNWLEANEELERLPAELRAASQVLVLRCRIYAMALRWQDVEMIAEGAAATYPQEPSFCTHWSNAVYRQGRTREALEIVTTAALRFPRSLEVAYSVACLNGASGNVAEARKWLERVFELANDPAKVKLKALDQPELAGVWRADGKAGKE